MIDMATQVYDDDIIPKVKQVNTKFEIKKNQVPKVLYYHSTHKIHYMHESTHHLQLPNQSQHSTYIPKNHTFNATCDKKQKRLNHESYQHKALK
jgi:hypothetical protein